MKKTVQFRSGKVKCRVDCSSDQVYEVLKSTAVHMVFPSFLEAQSEDPDIKFEEEQGDAHYIYRDGNTVRLSLGRDAPEWSVLFHLVGWVDLIAQEKYRTFMVHSSAVSQGNDCYIFQGGSNSGKTILALAMKDRGFCPISLDHTLIEFSNEELAVVGGTRAVRIKPAAIKENFPNFEEMFPGTDFATYEPKMRGIIDYTPPETRKRIKGVYLVHLDERAGFSVEPKEPFDYQIFTFPDASKYVKGNHLLDSETPATNLDRGDLARWRLSAIKELSRQKVYNIRGRLDNIVDYILSAK